MITLATGKIEEAEQERTGLVDAHAYAVLDLRKVDVRSLSNFMDHRCTGIGWEYGM